MRSAALNADELLLVGEPPPSPLTIQSKHAELDDRPVRPLANANAASDEAARGCLTSRHMAIGLDEEDMSARCVSMVGNGCQRYSAACDPRGTSSTSTRGGNDVLHVGLAVIGESAIVVLKIMQSKKGHEEESAVKPNSAVRAEVKG